MRAVRLAVVVMLGVSACAPGVIDRVRGEASATRRDELRLECPRSEIVVDRVREAPDPVTGEPRATANLTSEDVGRFIADGELYLAWCRSPGCCARAAGDGVEAVAVHCPTPNTCHVVGDTLGACLTMNCAFY